MNHQILITKSHSLWQAQGIARPPARRSDVVKAEKKWRVHFPTAFIALYLQTDGMEEGVMDDRLIRFWPICEIVPASTALEIPPSPIHQGFLAFADWSLWCHGYAIRLGAAEDAGSVWLIGGDQPMQVAASFTVFLEYYLEEPRRLFLPGN